MKSKLRQLAKSAKIAGKYLTTFAVMGMMALSNPMQTGAGPQGELTMSENTFMNNLD